MTLSELGNWRKIVPFTISGLCILPWFLVTARNLDEAKLANELVVPAISLLVAFIYVALNLRGPLWDQERQKHVHKQIRNNVLAMIPRDLEITDEETGNLNGEILKELTGVFWEAVDRNERLRAHKEHFYSNGIVYTTAIDVYLIGAFFGFLYVVASYLTHKMTFGYGGALLVVISLVSKYFFIPRIRTRHLILSRAQLELLRREEADSVSSRLTQIVIGWRRDRILGGTGGHM
jgi:hypothetical protein